MTVEYVRQQLENRDIKRDCYEIVEFLLSEIDRLNERAHDAGMDHIEACEKADL